MRLQWSTMLLASGAALLAALGQPVSAQTEIGERAAPRFLFSSSDRTVPVPVDANRTPLLHQRLTLELNGVTVRDALATIAKRSGISIWYNDDVIPARRRVHLSAADITVAEALAEVLVDTDVDVIFGSNGAASLVKRGAKGVKAAAAPLRIGGVVRDENGAPLAGAIVTIEQLSLSTITDNSGIYVLVVPEQQVQGQTVVLKVRSIGYKPAEQSITLTGATQTINLALERAVFSLDAVVVTGVVDPVSGSKLPFTVSTLGPEDMPIPTTSAAIGAVQGKVAGVNMVRGSGQPGSDMSVVLRTPTSIAKSSAPLYVVDGVILGESTVDLESLDIERIEIVKGAAGAALYGSKAGSGVISITTRRGADIPQGKVQFKVRSEYGQSELPSGVPLAESHYFRMNDNGEFVTAGGVPITASSQRVVKDDRIMDLAYPGPLYDNIKTFFRPGEFRTQSATVGYNSAPVNLSLSLNNYKEKGTIVTNGGYERNNARLNLDYRISDAINISTSMYHNRAFRDELSSRASGSGLNSPFWDMMMFGPDVDLSARDSNGNYINQPDPAVSRENPIWRQTTRDNNTKRSRTLLSGAAHYRPLRWLNLDGSVSYDLSDIKEHLYVPKGVPRVTSTDDEAGADGRLFKEVRTTGQLNGDLSAQALWRLGDFTARTMVRGLMERQQYDRVTADGRDFRVRDVPKLELTRRQFIESYTRDIRANAFFVQTGFDYRDKYIGDALVRRDGSSLFGPDARWATYYRGSLAWRMTKEPWWPIQSISEFKLRASQGTAGGRPNFSDQYETWTMNSNGKVTKGTLGNRDLKPEHTTEREIGLDVIAFKRFQLELTHARQSTSDQLIQIPMPASLGYSSQWQNAGTLQGTTYEASLQALLLQQKNLKWTSTLVWDRSRSKITEWKRDCYFNNFALRCLNSNLSHIWGEKLVTSVAELPENLRAQADEFQINDDGYLVWVGAGGNYTQGRWGEETEIDDITYGWGLPFVLRDSLGNVRTERIGNGNPNFSLGWINRVQWKNFTFHVHLHSQVGGQVYNHTRQRLYQYYRHGDLDQTGRPQELKKPIDYYFSIYNQNNYTSAFVEDAGFIKLREATVQYSLRKQQLQKLGLSGLGAERITLGLIGRNLFTRTPYRGYDPEVGTVFQREDYMAWPNTRTVTMNVEIQF